MEVARRGREMAMYARNNLGAPDSEKDKPIQTHFEEHLRFSISVFGLVDRKDKNCETQNHVLLTITYDRVGG